MAGALDKLFERAESTLELQQKNGAAHWKDLVGVITPSQPLLPPKISDEVTQVVHLALIAKEQFKGSYRNVKGEQEERLFNPLGLMFREPTIYLIAIVEGHDEPRMFAMHRFLSAVRAHIPVFQPEGFTLQRFLEEQGNFGIGKWLTLRARVSPHLATILGETPLGTSQRLGDADQDGWRNLSVRVRDNWQLRWWLMAQGERIVVLAPTETRNRIMMSLDRLNQLYGEN